MASGAPFALGMLGPSLIASHASASLSGTGLTVDIISGGGAMSGLVAKTSGVVGRRTGKGIAITPFSDVSFSILGIRGCVDIGWNGSERHGVGGLFILHKRGLEGIDPQACCCRNGFVRVVRTAPTGTRRVRTRVGLAKFLQHLGKRHCGRVNRLNYAHPPLLMGSHPDCIDG